MLLLPGRNLNDQPSVDCFRKLVVHNNHGLHNVIIIIIIFLWNPITTKVSGRQLFKLKLIFSRLMFLIEIVETIEFRQ